MTDNVVVEVTAPSRASAVISARALVQTLGSADATIGQTGLLGQWQSRNRSATIRHTITELRQAGNLDNLRAVAQPGSAIALERDAAGRAPTAYRGRYPFLDTDVFKTLEGIAYEIGRGAADDETREFFEEAVSLIESAQREDGYLNSYFQAENIEKNAWDDLAWGHELYNLGHLIQAAVAASRQMGDQRLLHVATRFADLVVAKLGPDGENAVDGHPEVEMALVELFRETGERNYLELAKLFVDRRGHGTVRLSVFPAEYFQDNAPFRELDSVTGHAVRMAYLAAGATDVALETGDETLLAASIRLWHDMSRTKLYITGGLGSRHSDEAIGDRYELPSERSYSETCAAIATMQWAWRLFLATGEAQYLDSFETVLYNAYAAGLSSDGCAFFYDNPLQRRPDHQQRTGAEPDGEILRRAWFVCPCCPPNIVRWMSELQDYLAVVDSDTLYVAQYTASSVSSAVLTVDVETEYPYDGTVRVSVTEVPESAGVRRSLALRVPAWCHSFAVTVNGEAADASTVGASTADRSTADGWLRIEREWVVGDVVELRLDMPARAHGSHPSVDGTRGAIAVARGPLVYAAEQQDNETPLDDVVLSAAQVARARAVPNDLDGHGDRGTVALVMPAARDAAAADLPLYPELGVAEASAPDPTASSTQHINQHLNQHSNQHAHHNTEATPTELTLVPYHLWGNRDPLTMRVWLRRSTHSTPSVTTERK